MEFIYRDKKGNPITVMEWGSLFEDFPYRIVTQEQVENLFISTVWLGVPHILWKGEELTFKGYFETAIINSEGLEKGMWRYETLEEAREGHKKIVENLILIDDCASLEDIEVTAR